MGRGVVLPGNKRKNWDWDIPRARNTLWKQPFTSPFRDLPEAKFQVLP